MLLVSNTLDPIAWPSKHFAKVRLDTLAKVSRAKVISIFVSFIIFDLECNTLEIKYNQFNQVWKCASYKFYASDKYFSNKIFSLLTPPRQMFFGWYVLHQIWHYLGHFIFIGRSNAKKGGEGRKKFVNVRSLLLEICKKTVFFFFQNIFINIDYFA